MLYTDPQYAVLYRGYKITHKRDFGDGFLIDGHKVTQGYNVFPAEFGTVEDMPGAAWFQTVKDAKGAIDDLIASGGRRIGRENEFWTRNRLRRATQDHGLDLYRAVVDHLERTQDATGGARALLAKVLAEIEDAVDTRDTIVNVAAGTKTRVGEFPAEQRAILNETE